MKIFKIILLIFIILQFTCQTYAQNKEGTSYIRVLIGDIIPKSNNLEKIKKVSAKAIVNENIYKGEIELWKSEEGYFLINVVELEEYVRGVVASEVGINWPIEALKAQAVLARTYAVKHIIRNRERSFYDVTSSVFHQVYKGERGSEDIERAVKETKGEILTYNKEPIMAFYHACSVGKTEEPKEVFGRDYPYLKSVEVPFTPSPYTIWEKKIPFELLQNALSLDKISGVEIFSHTDTGRIKEFKFIDGKNEKFIKATELRRLLKWSTLPSTRVTNVRIEEDGIVFEGHGYGHGVGMCQWCAFKMAYDGKNYKEILQYFYSGTEISKINENN